MKKLFEMFIGGAALFLIWISIASACGLVGRVTRWAFDQGWEFLGKLF